MASGSVKVVVAALVGNALIAVCKFGAASYTGSSAMFSEAVHSLVDTCNQGLLLYGIRRAGKTADATHPFGYGKELYFWAFVVALLIFSAGSAVSIYEGIHKINAPEAITDPYINYIVLSLAMVFEGGAWWIAFKEFRKNEGRGGLLKAIRASKDPAIFTVLMEDSAAMLGLMVAFVGIALGQWLEMPIFDAIASLVIGGILALAAVLLLIETKALLIGEAASPEVVSNINDFVNADPRVERVNDILTMHLGPQDILVTVSLDFSEAASSTDVEEAVSELEQQMKQKHPAIKRVFIEAQGWRAHLRNKVSTNAG